MSADRGEGQAGPCVGCGATNYALSMGGPSICPLCDVGPATGARIRQQQIEALRAALRASEAALAEARRDVDRLFETAQSAGDNAQTFGRMLNAIAEACGQRDAADVVELVKSKLATMTKERDELIRGEASVGSSSGPEEVARSIHPKSPGDETGVRSLRGRNRGEVATPAADVSPMADIVSRLAYAVHHDAHPGREVHLPGVTCNVFDNMAFHFDMAYADLVRMVEASRAEATKAERERIVRVISIEAEIGPWIREHLIRAIRSEVAPHGCTCGETWPCPLHGGPPSPGPCSRGSDGCEIPGRHDMCGMVIRLTRADR